MKKRKNLYIISVLLFVCLGIGANWIVNENRKQRNESQNIAANRLVDEVTAAYESEPRTDDVTISVMEALDNVYYDRLNIWQREYGNNRLPEEIQFLDIHTEGKSILLNPNGKGSKIWGVYHEGELLGFLVLEYPETGLQDIQQLMNIFILIAAILCLGIIGYVDVKILRPFEDFSTYPERLSKNEISEKLPDSKNRFFGKFIWGVNMLSDRLKNDQARINKLEMERQTMLTTVAHGIKTPLANIKLYTDAITTGLYQPDGAANEKDAEIAEKISDNADEIAELVKNLIETTSNGLVDFEPEEQTFYLKELQEFLTREYENRLQVLRIPYFFDLESNLLIKSDKSGICRILTQLMENAIKYGNGEGINVYMEKGEDGYYIAVKNKGELPKESELPYLFNSFWRGSNAENVEGSGIGLFEAREIARKLGGDIFVRIDEKKGEMEFVTYLP